MYISSADWMTRNIDYRVEVSCPIYDQEIKQELLDNFEIGWSDNVKARVFSENKIMPTEEIINLRYVHNLLCTIII